MSYSGKATQDVVTDKMVAEFMREYLAERAKHIMSRYTDREVIDGNAGVIVQAGPHDAARVTAFALAVACREREAVYELMLQSLDRLINEVRIDEAEVDETLAGPTFERIRLWAQDFKRIMIAQRGPTPDKVDRARTMWKEWVNMPAAKRAVTQVFETVVNDPETALRAMADAELALAAEE